MSKTSTVYLGTKFSQLLLIVTTELFNKRSLPGVVFKQRYRLAKRSGSPLEGNTFLQTTKRPAEDMRLLQHWFSRLI